MRVCAREREREREREEHASVGEERKINFEAEEDSNILSSCMEFIILVRSKT